ncbi:MAG TPA: pyridoxal-phosphate dependent enzyme [Terriglobales bacterium]|nr:pyridoxal-phosphate dependent enzyme [Terriglobales bacterium]
MPVPFSAVHRARTLLRQYLPVTRLVAAPSLSRITGAKLFLKLETDLPTGSFKPRGALYALSLNLSRRNISEVIASSTGNHGAAVAYAGKMLGLPARIFLPKNPNPVKRARIAELGAEIVLKGALDSAAAFELASAYAKKKDVYFLNDATDPDLPAGPGTIACEIMEQQPDTQVIYIPIGDTALIRGVAAAAKHLSPSIRIIGVQAEQAPSYYLSWKHGHAISTETCETIADGLATRMPDEGNVGDIRELVDDVQLVTEGQMLRAVRHLVLEEHIVAEPAGAAATAALLQSAERNKTIVALVTGSNISPEVLQRAVCGEG